MKAQDMMAKGYFEHTSPQGISPWYWFDQSGYDYRYAGENLAIGFIDSGEVNNAWLASPAHKANILNGNYRETGTAVLSGNFQGGQTTVVVQLFGTKTSGLFGKALVNQMPKPSPAAVPPAALAALSGQAMAQKVLGAYDLEGTTRSVLQTPDDGAIPYRVTSFLASGYFVMAQRIMYGSLFFIIIMLGLNFALKADFKHRDLLFKSIGFLVLLAMFLAMDKQMILALIPHLTVIS